MKPFLNRILAKSISQTGVSPVPDDSQLSQKECLSAERIGVWMFADSAKIFIKSGKGGDGHVSFRKELFVPAGGPDGGDGGKGGDIIFEVDPGLNTLTDFRHVRKYAAKDGEQGGKKRCHGANAENLLI